MAKECIYYFMDSYNDYCCSLLKNRGQKCELDSDWVHRYCWSYDHEECPHFRSEGSSSGGCYLTSACVKSQGLGDNCEELTLLRKFRDTYLKALPDGQKDIKHYYDVAPKIVEKINLQRNSCEIWNGIYNCMILPCVELIKSDKLYQAYTLYKHFSLNLEKQFLEEM